MVIISEVISKYVMLSLLSVYDTSCRATFDKLEEWLNEVEMYSTKKDIVKMLVGNKIDKVEYIIMTCHALRAKPAQYYTVV